MPLIRNPNHGHYRILEALLTTGNADADMLGDDVADVRKYTIAIDLVLLQKVDC